MTKNLKLAITTAKAMGHPMKDVTPETFLERHKLETLACLYEILKDYLLKDLNFEEHPSLINLLKETETVEDFGGISQDDLLLRWFNYHLANAEHDPITNFSTDLMDGEAYTLLLNQLDADNCDKSGLEDTTNDCFVKILDNAETVGAIPFIEHPDDISDGHPKLNLLFVASIYNANNGMEDEIDEEEIEKTKAALHDKDSDPRLERMFKNYINSLGIDGVHCNSIFTDLSDGLILLKVLDKVEPGCVT